VQDVLDQYGFYPLPRWDTISEEDWKVISTISEAESFQEAAQVLNSSIEKLGQKIGVMRDGEIFPRKGQDFNYLKRYSQQLIQRYSTKKKLENIEKQLMRIWKALSEMM
ncbi:MAG: hypothetical protein GWO20_02110, partial [Candidatus Korarchaeota archaeon]|nr:hypothetical protein [Candidatus Korarchaeota archaeon]NIU84952.1 hypothetical protein [Candidatus Thorarchaeota archaeon]NIW12769.1 hypothetical protein [Candidatus Thorarchaeota archaeon]NIW50976.1 hypothetical protein [Candidatus Korarchaeota archaeon]